MKPTEPSDAAHQPAPRRRPGKRALRPAKHAAAFEGLAVALPCQRRFDVAAQVIRHNGGRPLRFSAMVESGELATDRFVQELWQGQFDDLVFASAQGVRLIVELSVEMGAGDRAMSALESVRKIAIGARARGALREAGLGVDIAIDGTSPGGVLEAIEQLDVSQRVVGVVGSDAEHGLLELLQRRGARVHRPTLGAELEQSAADLLGRLLSGEIACLFLGSTAEVEELAHAAAATRRTQELRERMSSMPVVAVGSDVSRELRRRGLGVALELTVSALEAPRTAELSRWLGLHDPTDPASAPDSVRALRNDRRALLIVGNGMVSHYLCERMLAHDVERRYRITVLGEERHPAYDRVGLRRAVGDLDAEQLALGAGRWYDDNGIRLLLNERAVKLQRDERVVVAASGRRIAFDVCVIATGSRAFAPPLPGADKRGVFGYRTFDDVAAITAQARSSQRAAVVALGPFSLDAVQAVLELGLETHVIHTGASWLPGLDAGAAKVVERRLSALGAHVHPGRVPVAILGHDAVAGLAFSDGGRLELDMLVLCYPTHPRDELGRQAGLTMSQYGGILVDDGLRTSDPAVYAVGECVAHRDRTFTTLGPCHEMAEVLAHNLTHETQRSFVGADGPARARLLDLECASFGDPLADAQTGRAILRENAEHYVYKKLALSEDGRQLVGGVLLGDTRSLGALLARYRTGAALPAAPEQLLDV